MYRYCICDSCALNKLHMYRSTVPYRTMNSTTVLYARYGTVVQYSCTCTSTGTAAPILHAPPYICQYCTVLESNSNDDLSRIPFLHTEFMDRYQYSSMNIDYRGCLYT